MSEFPKEKIDKYVASGGYVCPECESTAISSTEQVQTDSYSAWQLIECHDCGTIFRDVYKLVGVEFVDYASKTS